MSQPQKPRRPPEGVAIILHRANTVAISARNNAAKTFFGRLQFPGGSVDVGETPLQAAAREVFEETGLQIDATRFRYLGSDTRQFELRPGGPARSTPPSYEGHCFTVPLEDHEVLNATELDKQGHWIFVTREQAIVLEAAFVPGLVQYLTKAF